MRVIISILFALGLLLIGLGVLGLLSRAAHAADRTAEQAFWESAYAGTILKVQPPPARNRVFVTLPVLLDVTITAPDKAARMAAAPNKPAQVAALRDYIDQRAEEVSTALSDPDLDYLGSEGLLEVLHFRARSRIGLLHLLSHPDITTVRLASEQAKLLLTESHAQIGIPSMRTANYNGDGSTIFIIDTGIAPDREPYVQGRVQLALDMTGEDPLDPWDRVGHGTEMAVAVARTAPTSPLITCKAGGTWNAVTGVYRPSLSSGAVRRCAEWAMGHQADYGIKVASLSFSMPGSKYSGSCSTDFTKLIIDGLVLFDILPVTSAGNDGDKLHIGEPGCADQGLTVGATWDYSPALYNFYQSGTPASDSTTRDLLCVERSPPYGSATCFSNSSAAVDVLAPGCSVTLWNFTSPTDGSHATSEVICGTSVATAIVAASMSIIRGTSVAPRLSAQAVTELARSQSVNRIMDRWSFRETPLLSMSDLAARARAANIAASPPPAQYLPAYRSRVIRSSVLPVQLRSGSHNGLENGGAM